MTRDERIAAILGDWLEARDGDSPPDLDALTAAHPDLADDLRRHLGVADLVSEAGTGEDVRVLGRYRVERELGRGGMGTVLLATDDRGQRFALKVLHGHLLAAEGFFKRFVREADVGRRIRHENVVRTLDFDAVVERDHACHFLVMEYVEGRTLRALYEELGPLPEELCLHVAREICKGLEAIHAAGAVHRDLKPENVIVATADDASDAGAVRHVVKIMDLGVARLIDEAARLSRTGAFVGSVHYAAPEQFHDAASRVDARADLYALGLLLYEVAGGVHPFVADGLARVIARILDDEPRRLGELNPQVSRFFEEVVHTLLSKRPEERFQTARELRAVLEEGERSAWWRDRARSLAAGTATPPRRVRIPRETAVYGRDDAIDRLRRRFERARAGDGNVVLVEGEAGVGKTRLVDELVARLEREDDAPAFLFGGYPPGGAAAARGAFSTAFAEHLGAEGAADRLVETPLLVAAFDAVLRGEPRPPGAVELSAESLATCFVHVLRRLAAERPTILLIDDLHFAHDDARALFTSVALAVPGHRVLLIGTTRPGLPAEWVANLTRLDHAEQLALDRLSPKDLALLLRDSFRSERLAEELGYKIALKSDGNPFFAFEIIRGLREGNFITQREDGTWVSTRVIEDIEIPSSVLDLVNARVGALDDEDRHLLDVAACCGYEFDAVLVGDALGMERVPVLQRFARIEKRDRLVRARGRRFVFDHHQVQEALYGALPDPLREEYHAALAAALEARCGAEADPRDLDPDVCVALCGHLLAGARGARALRYLPVAQERLREACAHARCVALTEQALAAPDVLTGTARAEALLALCTSYGPLDMLGRRERQEEVAREALSLATAGGDDALRSRAGFALATALWRVGRNDEAEVELRRAHDLDPRRGEPAAEAAFASHLAGVAGDRGRLEEAVRLHRWDLSLSREAGDRRGEARALGNLGRVYLQQGRLDDAREHVERYLALCREIGNREGEAIATGNLGGVLYSLGSLDEAAERYERASELSRRIGDRQGEGRAEVGLGNADAARGRLVAAREHVERALALSRETGYRRSEAAATMNLGSIEHSLGRLAAAHERYEAARALHAAIGNRPSVAIADHNVAGVLAELGDTDEAERRLLASLEISGELGLRRLHAASLLALAQLRVETRGAAAAREALVAALDFARAHGFRAQETLALCALAAASVGDPVDALAAFAANEDVLEEEDRREARYLLFRATGDRAHLDAARRSLDDLLARVPAQHHDAVRTQVRLHREILAAASER